MTDSHYPPRPLPLYSWGWGHGIWLVKTQTQSRYHGIVKTIKWSPHDMKLVDWNWFNVWPSVWELMLMKIEGANLRFKIQRLNLTKLWTHSAETINPFYVREMWDLICLLLSLVTTARLFSAGWHSWSLQDAAVTMVLSWWGFVFSAIFCYLPDTVNKTNKWLRVDAIVHLDFALLTLSCTNLIDITQPYYKLTTMYWLHSRHCGMS